MALSKLASNGKPGSIGGVHIDVIESIEVSRSYDRTSTALEDGAPVTSHRQRRPFELQVVVYISDVEPVFGAELVGLWERNHARKTRNRLFALQESGEQVRFFDGAEFRRGPGSSLDVWVIDSIDETSDGEKVGTWRATIKLGELVRFASQFTDALPDVDPALADLADGIADKGLQSTEAVPSNIASGIPV